MEYLAPSSVLPLMLFLNNTLSLLREHMKVQVHFWEWELLKNPVDIAIQELRFKIDSSLPKLGLKGNKIEITESFVNSLKV